MTVRLGPQSLQEHVGHKASLVGGYGRHQQHAKSAASQRSRPTNNQLSYKAHFRWKHYSEELEQGTELPVGTEACASVTSAFLQILAIIHNVEACRVHKARNILSILSTNTRRTKVVELSSGTHRVADELRRHSLSDGMGGHYSTNLDRNRYGSDNNYLFTVTRYNLESLGLCPCLVDIEIVDTRNGNEVQIVTAGPEACSCDSPERAELANADGLGGTSNASGLFQGNAAAISNVHHKSMRRVASAGTMGQGMRRAASTSKLYGETNNSGSELFDALLMAATGEVQTDAKSQGEAPVSSRQRACKRQRSYLHLHDDDFDDDAILTGGALGRRRSTSTMPRRNSVSMIVENPVLAQTGAGDSLIVQGHYFGLGGDDAHNQHRESHSDQGDTENHHTHGNDDFEHQVTSIPAGNQQGNRLFHKQSSAVNLARLGGGAVEARRLAGELRQLREERRQLELALEESKSAQKQAEKNAEEAKAAARKASDIADALRKAALKSGVALEEELEQKSKYLPTSEQEIELLKAELAETKAELASRRDFDIKKLPKQQQAAAAAAAAAFAQMPYAMGMLPMFGMPPLNPYGGMAGMPPMPPGAKGLNAMQKVASMPAMHGLMSPPADRAASHTFKQEDFEDGKEEDKKEEDQGKHGTPCTVAQS